MSERRAKNAARMRVYRDARIGMIESRTTDRMLAEALALHLERIDKRAAKTLLEALQPLVVDGLVHKGHPRSEAKEAFDRRMRSLLTPEADEDRPMPSGFVRMAAKARSLGRKPGGFFRVTP